MPYCCTDVQCVPLATEPGIEDIATKFEQEYVRCVRNEEECVCSVCLLCAKLLRHGAAVRQPVV